MSQTEVQKLREKKNNTQELLHSSTTWKYFLLLSHSLQASNELVLTLPALICPADSGHLLLCALACRCLCVCVLFSPLNEETKEVQTL